MKWFGHVTRFLMTLNWGHVKLFCDTESSLATGPLQSRVPRTQGRSKAKTFQVGQDRGATALHKLPLAIPDGRAWWNLTKCTCIQLSLDDDDNDNDEQKQSNLIH